MCVPVAAVRSPLAPFAPACTPRPPCRWPFAAGFAFTSYIMIKVATSVTDEDVKNSKFVNPKH